MRPPCTNAPRLALLAEAEALERREQVPAEAVYVALGIDGVVDEGATPACRPPTGGAIWITRASVGQELAAHSEPAGMIS